MQRKMSLTESLRNTINQLDILSEEEYRGSHGESVLNGKYKIISKIVPANQVFTNADSIREWGWNP